MWAFTPIGFYSIVAHRDDPNKLMVRARVKSDLEAFRDRFCPELGEIIFTKYRDYPYRAFVKRADVAAAYTRFFMTMQYDNFKDSVTRNQGWARSSVYMRVWNTMTQIEEDPDRFSHYLSGPPEPAKKRKRKRKRNRDEHKARFEQIILNMNDGAGSNSVPGGTEG